MNKTESQEILLKVLGKFRQKPYDDLAKLVEDGFNLKNTHYEEVDLKNGNCFQVRVNVFWDDKKTKTLRVVGSIDDGGLTALSSNY